MISYIEMIPKLEIDGSLRLHEIPIFAIIHALILGYFEDGAYLHPINLESRFKGDEIYPKVGVLVCKKNKVSGGEKPYSVVPNASGNRYHPRILRTFLGKFR